MKISTFCYSLIFLCAGFCCPEEDDVAGEVYELDREDLVEIKDSETIFSLNDTIWVKTEVPVLLEYESRIINISEVSGNSTKMNIPFGFYEITNYENLLEVSLSENEVIQRTGDISSNYGLHATAYLEDDKFINEFGIILKEQGDFIISSSYEPHPIYLYVETSSNTVVYIKTTFKDSDNPQEYRITVE